MLALADRVACSFTFLDLANAQTPRVEAHNAVVKAVKVPLMLGYEQGLEIPIAVPRDLNWQLAVIAAQRLFCCGRCGHWASPGAGIVLP